MRIGLGVYLGRDAELSIHRDGDQGGERTNDDRHARVLGNQRSHGHQEFQVRGCVVAVGVVRAR